MEERLQVKCNYDEGMMHIQGVSNDVNQGREYGFATKVRTTTEVSMWLRDQPAVMKSAASGTLAYTPFQIIRYSNKVPQIFIPGTPGNHPSGAVLNMHPLSAGIKNLLQFAEKAGFIEESKEEPYTTDEVKE